MICSFSDLPLILPFFVAAIAFVLGGFMTITTIFGALFGMGLSYSVRWFTILFLLMTGTQSIVTGLIAQYILKINTETTNRPIYIVKETLKEES